MARIPSTILIICLCMLSVSCSGGSPWPGPTPVEARVIESDNAFGFSLFEELAKRDRDENICVSPLSIAMSLGMAVNGADAATAEAIEETLGLSGLTIDEINESYRHLMEVLSGLDPEVRFELANSVWLSLGSSVEQDFIDLSKTYFDADVRSLDFDRPGAADVINEWVAHETNGSVRDIGDIDLLPIDVMLLINVIYFKGAWTYKFKEESTRDGWFTVADGSTSACEMMVQNGCFEYTENADFQAMDLPYGNGEFSMTVLLPRPEKTVDSLILDMRENWDQWIESLSEEMVDLELPRFTVEHRSDLKDVLTTLGMGIAFEPGDRFPQMASGLWINEVKHNTFLRVDEAGTEAAGATGLDIIASIPKAMRVDRPFLFAIREHRSQTILFIGKVVDPSGV